MLLVDGAAHVDGGLRCCRTGDEQPVLEATHEQLAWSWARREVVSRIRNRLEDGAVRLFRRIQVTDRDLRARKRDGRT